MVDNCARTELQRGERTESVRCLYLHLLLGEAPVGEAQRPAGESQRQGEDGRVQCAHLDGEDNIFIYKSTKQNRAPIRCGRITHQHLIPNLHAQVLNGLERMGYRVVTSSSMITGYGKHDTRDFIWTLHKVNIKIF